MDRRGLDLEALSKVGGDLHFFLQRCTYLAENPEVPPPVGAGFLRWDNRSVVIFTVLTGAILEVWATGGGQDIHLPKRPGETVELQLLLAREPESGPGRQLLLRASTRERLEQLDGQWRWSLAFTGASINAACTP
jgi:hypothetical protein